MSEFLLENGFGVGQVDECCLVRLDLNVGSLIEVHVSQDDLGAFLDAQIIHHPDRDVAHAFLSRELKDATVGLDSHL